MPIWDEKSDENYKVNLLKLIAARKYRLECAFETLGSPNIWNIGELFEQSNVKVKIIAKDDFVIIDSHDNLRPDILKPK